MSFLDKKLKNIVLIYFYVIIAVLFIYCIYYWIQGIYILRLFVEIFLLVHCLLLFIPKKLDYSNFKVLIPTYLGFMSIIIYVLVLMFWQLGQLTTVLWYFLIPMGAMLFFSIKTVVYWCLLIFVQICSIFLISTFYHFDISFFLTTQEISAINMLTIVFFLLFFFFFLISWLYLNNIKIQNLKGKDSHYPIDEDDRGNVNQEKFQLLYERITEFFEKEKPYCDPNFTITHLAMALDSNVNYIARAIKLNNHMNFSVFINTYKVTMIKDMLNNNLHRTYTIKHIYTSAGFKYQSTFNKVFKQIEGITPTDYIKYNLMNKADQDISDGL